jgi:hypothetical protein
MLVNNIKSASNKAFVIMRGPNLFTERSVSRVLRAVKKAGVPARVEIDRHGTIAIIHTPIEPMAEKVSDPASDWDAAINGKRS